MNLTALQTAVYSLLGTSGTNNDRLSSTVLTELLNDEYVQLCCELPLLTRTVVLATSTSVTATYTVTVLDTIAGSDTVTLTIGGIVYRLVDLTGTEPWVRCGSVVETAANLVAALNAAGASESPQVYGPVALARNQFVSAAAIDGVTGGILLTARLTGTLGNLTITSNTPAKLSVAITSAGVDGSSYTVPGDTATIRGARCGDVMLRSTSEMALDAGLGPDWRDAVPGQPYYFYLTSAGKMVLCPPPDGSNSLVLSLQVAPIAGGTSPQYATLSSGSDAPAFPEMFHKILVYGVVRRVCTNPLFEIENAVLIAQSATAYQAQLLDRLRGALTAVDW